MGHLIQPQRMSVRRCQAVPLVLGPGCMLLYVRLGAAPPANSAERSKQ